MEYDSGCDDPVVNLMLFARGRIRDVALSSHSRGKSRSKSRNQRIKCQYCKGEGHWKTKCPKLKEKKEVDIGNTLTVVEGAGIILSIATTLVGDAWIINSGYSYHMCPNQDRLTTY